MSSETAISTPAERLRAATRGAGAAVQSGRAWLRRTWARRWVRRLAILLAIPLLAAVLLWFVFSRGLPSGESLLTYQPPLPTNVRGIDGEPVQTYARERRVELAYEEFPRQLIQAFLAAEDRTFFEHGGIDYPGIVGAIITNLKSDGRPVGASTITQQVAKNLLLTSELSYTRKIKEAILARRIENVLSKQQILELYLNQIFLGRNAYGVQAAARAYFDKDLDQLALHEFAYLAVLPKAPSNYDPVAKVDRATGRRNFILSEMERNGFISAAQRADAASRPIGAVRGPSNSIRNVGGYYMEEVRRQLIDTYGEVAKDGPNGIYQGGLWVRTSYDRTHQKAAETALRDGLMRYDRGRGWRDPELSVDPSKDWRGELAAASYGVGYDDWRAAVVLEKSGGSATIGLADGSTGTLPAWAAAMPKRGVGGTAFSYLRPGMVIAVKPEGGVYTLRSVPEISGGMVVEEVATGRVLAMQGGFDVRGGSFNRAVQAQRQPGSTFKPIVYAAAMDNGLTPASMIVDGPFCVYQGANLGQKCFRNFGNMRGAGTQTMRWGVEQSRNLMTVRTANQIGMQHVTRLSTRMGVGDYPNYLAIALGAGDTTVLKMTNAFAILANNGKALKPTLVDYVQDRAGKTIFRADTRPCERCNMPDWDGRPMPRPPLRTKQVLDPMTAYQMVHILEGVVERGTATVLRDLGRPLFGKTGTTSGPTNVWFVGGSQDVVAGVYMGYDKPRSMGGYAQGGTLAAPIFKQYAQVALKDMPVVPFRAPEGIRMVRIDRRSGRRVFGAWPAPEPKAAVIWEAFKPESEPRRSIRRDELADPKALLLAAKARAAARVRADTRDSDFLQREGGIY